MTSRPLLLALALPLLLASSAKAQELPLKAVPPALRAEVEAVWNQPTVRCNLAPRPVAAKSEVYRTLLQQLPQASRWLRALELGTYKIHARPKQRFEIDDEAGAHALCERVVDKPGLLIVVARGWIDVPLLPKITGTGVIVIRYPRVKLKAKPGSAKAPSPALRCSAQVAFRVKGRLLHALGRTFRRTLRRVIAAKLKTLIVSATQLAVRVSQRPQRVYEQLRPASLPPADPTRKPLLSKRDLASFRKLFLVRHF